MINKKNMKDKIVTDVIELFQQRSAAGIKKYGTTLEQNNTDDFIQHLQEELMDAILYLQKIKDTSNSEIPNISDQEIHLGIIKHCNIPHDRLLAEINAMIEGAKWYLEQLKKK
jgi:hypothetical protein